MALMVGSVRGCTHSLDVSGRNDDSQYGRLGRTQSPESKQEPREAHSGYSDEEYKLRDHGT